MTRLNMARLAVTISLWINADNLYARSSGIALNCGKLSGFQTEVEMKKLPSQGIYTVDVTYIVKRPPDKDVERALRECLAVAAKRDGTMDILGSAWLRKRVGAHPNDDDKLDPHKGPGLKYISYHASSKTISVRELTLKRR